MESPPARSGATGGGVGEMTTPELLAKREQRRRMEAQAAALSRPSLSRRLLQPLHNQPQLQQHQPATSSGQQQAGRSVFSRAGLKRPAPTAKAAAPPPAADAPAGISAEDLAKLMDDEPAAGTAAGTAAGAADHADGGCAKRPKLSELLKQNHHQQQQAGDTQTPAIRPALLTVQQQDRHASVSTAFGRVAAQRQQQQHQQEQADMQALQHTEAADTQAFPTQQWQQQQQVLLATPPDANGTGSTDKQATRQNERIPPQDSQQQQQQQPQSKPCVGEQPQVDAAVAAAAGDQPAQPTHNGVPRWLYVKPGTAVPAAQQEQQQAAGATGRGQQAGSRGSGKAGRAGSRRSQSGRSQQLADKAEAVQGAAEGSAAAAAAAGPCKKLRRAAGRRKQEAAATTAAADSDVSEQQPPAAAVAANRAARPRRQAAAAAARALTRGRAAGEPSDHDGSSSSSDADGCSSSGGSSDEEHVKQQPRTGRVARRAGARAPAGKAAAANLAPAAAGGDAAAAATAGKNTSRRKSSAAAADGSTKLSRHMQKLQDAVSGSRRAQALAAAMQQPQPLEQERSRPPASKQQQRVLAAKHPLEPEQQRQQQQSAQRVQQQGGAAAAPAATQPGSHLTLSPDLAAKVQAAVAAKAAAGANDGCGAAAGVQAQPGSVSLAAVAAGGGSTGDLMLLDESDDLETLETPAAPAAAATGAAATAPAAGVASQQAFQQQPAARAAAAHEDTDVGEGAWRDNEGHPSDGLWSDGQGDSSSGWEESDGSEMSGSVTGDEGEEEGAEEHAGSSGSSSSSSGGEDTDDDVPLARRCLAGRRRPAGHAAAAAAGSDGSGEEQEGAEGGEGSDDDAPTASRRRDAGVGRSSRAARSKRASAAGGGQPEPGADGAAAVAAPKGGRKRSAKAPAAARADGGVKKRNSRKAAAAAGGNAKASKPRARKPAQRQNFRRHKTSASGYSSKFLSKAAVKGGGLNRKWAYKGITKSGKLVRVRRQAPHMAGQGAEFMEGFGGAGGGRGKGRCYTCGQAGHWEEDCPLLAARLAEQEAELAAWMRDNPDAEEAQRVAGGNGSGYRAAAAVAAGTDGAQAAAAAGAAGTDGAQAAAAAGAASSQAPRPPPAQQQQQQGQAVRGPPLTQAQLCEMAELPAGAPWVPEQLTDEQLACVLKAAWGHSGFRGQQLPLIRAALRGSSMLGVLPTGLGKSMTYQLPALLMQGLVVVVSPLLSLMHDQVSRLPACLPGAMLQGTMGRDEVLQVLSEAESGSLRLLYLAPEKLSSGPVMSCLRRLSHLQLVVVDEAHCMAEWGEGFRPAYFRLGHLITNILQPRAVLALSATAAPRTRASILQLLHIPPPQQVVESPLRDNLRLRVVHVAAGAARTGVPTHIVQLLKTGELSGVTSAVVYVNTRAGADMLAAQLKRASINSAAYHAGLRHEQRQTVQDAFLRGHLRVMVATIAFGMGLDKPDLEAVIHANMPHSLEEYVQQVGRGGRDGRVATCISFLDDADYTWLRTLTHQKVARQDSVERFLRVVFGRQEDEDDEREASAPAAAAAAAAGSTKPAKRRKAQPKATASQHKVLPFTSFCSQHDIDKEQLDSCLSFLQADPLEPYVAVLPNVAATLDVRFHSTAPEVLAKRHPVVASILQSKARVYSGTYKVHMNVLVPFTDRPPGEIISELSALAAARDIAYDQSHNEQALAWRIIRQPEDWEGLVQEVCSRLDRVVDAAVSRLDRCYEALAGASIYSAAPAQEKHLRCMIEQYFLQDGEDGGAAGVESAAGTGSENGGSADDAGDNMLPWGVAHPVLRVSRDFLLRQLRAALHTAAPRARDLGPGRFDGLVLARLVTGLSSPAVPQSFWNGCHEWGRMQAHDFRRVADAAQQVVAEFWAAEGGSRLRVMG